ncbi:hypothetical protein [Paracoccus marinaquae]|uniref:Uncharacterized protein n=1 Tax=Paracoccus marinaquae TaxID=2841926 RepID=A0ABS6AEI2_9RHOB|nr:hypothetical protein [Paracoccus marinaquae]MBU3028616.1 hypothetical protein [Paracoccus marinaquae]
MLLPTLFLLMEGMGDAATAMSPEMTAFADEASAWVLEGKSLPPDYRVRLLRMEPAVRLQLIVFLRRAGLLTDTAWSLEDILRPAVASQEGIE